MITELKTALLGGGYFFFAVTIDEHSLVPLGSAAFVLLGVWHLSSRLQKLEDGQSEINRRLKKLEQQGDTKT